MERDPFNVMPSEDAHISSLMSDQLPSADAVLERISDAQRTSTPSTLIQPPASASQLEEDSMSDQSSDSDSSRPTSHTLSESFHESLSPDASQPEGISEGAHTSPFVPSAVDPTIPSSEDRSHSAGSNRECEGPPASSSTRGTLESCPLLMPLPESDDEEEDPSMSARAESARSSANSGIQTGAAYTTHTNERTNTTRADVPNIVRPSKSLPFIRAVCRSHILYQVKLMTTRHFGYLATQS
jgi:hypothetical protein